MKYILRITRPLIDDQYIDMLFESRQDCSIALGTMILMESIDNSDFSVVKHEVTGGDGDGSILTVGTSTGTYTCFPKPNSVN